MASEPVVHVIDDDDAVRRSLDFLLTSSGVAVRTYGAPSVFLKAAGRLADGCVVTDIRMPEMNGLELMRRVRELGVRLPFIVITGHGDIALAIEAMRAGVIQVLEKPFSDEDLLSAVGKALDGAQSPS